MSLELHRQCVFPALAVVGGVDGVNVPPPARKLGGVIPADTVELHGMDSAQRTDKPLRAVLSMIQLHKVHHAPQDSRPEGIRSALPRFHDVPQGFAVDFFAQLVVQLQRRAHAADAVVAQLHAVVKCAKAPCFREVSHTLVHFGEKEWHRNRSFDACTFSCFILRR